VALLLIGFAIKLAFLPLYFWLPGVAVAGPMTIALIVAAVDIAEFAELITVRIQLPWVFNEYFGLWLGIALLSMFGGALLALAQTDLKRMLAFSTIDDMGYLLIGVLAGTQLGLGAAVLGAMSHSIFKVILFGSVGVAERGMGRPITLSERGLASRFPLSAAAFILASIGFLGVPPLFGFLGRWRLYLTGLQIGGFALGFAMVIATALALYYYVRAIHLVWLGGPSAEKSDREPKRAAAVLIALIVLALVLGLFPGLLLGGM
jgi:multicomponent Na+:H+ antiporter subunit D